MILDARESDKTLRREMKRRFPSLEITNLTYGDFQWRGNGENGAVVIGAERKTLLDLRHSMEDGRLIGRQLPGLSRFCSGHVYLVIEGVYKVDKDGCMLIPRGRGWRPLGWGSRGGLRYSAYVSFLNTIAVMTDVTVVRTAGPSETAKSVEMLHRWWVKPWSGHRGLADIPTPKKLEWEAKVGEGVKAVMSPTYCLKFLAFTVPGVGKDKAVLISRKFKSIESIVDASEKELMSIPGVGRVLAKRIKMVTRSEK